MKYFLDSAKLNEIDYAYKAFGIDGVTTNPRHIMASGKPFLQAITDIANWIKENHLEGKDVFPVSVEINPHLEKAEDMVREGKKIAALCENFVIKIPCNVEGCKAAKMLEDEGIRTNVTLVFSTSQALQAGRIGAMFVSPFIGWKVLSKSCLIIYPLAPMDIAFIIYSSSLKVVRYSILASLCLLRITAPASSPVIPFILMSIRRISGIFLSKSSIASEPELPVPTTSIS